MDIERARELVKHQLSEKRFEHTIRVTDTAILLAEQYGSSVELVTIAALLHDYAKDMDSEKLANYIKQYRLPNDLFNYNIELWHGPVAAKIVENKYKVTNQEIINAIYYHTTGRENMSLLELIVFVADYIEPARDFPGVEIVREHARENLYVAARLALKNTIHFLLDKDVTIHPNTFLAYNDLTKTIGVSKT